MIPREASAESKALIAHIQSLLEEVPVGLLLLDERWRPWWFNAEAARACQVWNRGEREAAALRPPRRLRVPSPLLDCCQGLQRAWQEEATAPGPTVVSDHALGLHARVMLEVAPAAGVAPAYQIQLDYRRPRGDRERPLSPGAVALLARLSAREREVAMRLREGLTTVEIAAELRRSPLTVKSQLAAIFAKLGVNRRARVVALLNR